MRSGVAGLLTLSRVGPSLIKDDRGPRTPEMPKPTGEGGPRTSGSAGETPSIRALFSEVAMVRAIIIVDQPSISVILRIGRLLACKIAPKFDPTETESISLSFLGNFP
jgi:hypothetical protein